MMECACDIVCQARSRQSLIFFHLFIFIYLNDMMLLILHLLLKLFFVTALLIFFDLFSRLGLFSVLNLSCKDIRQDKLRANSFDRASSDIRLATVLTALAWSRHRVGLIAESVIRVE